MRHRGPILKANSKKLDVKRRHNALTGLDRMQLFYMNINIVRMVGLFNHFKSASLKVYIRRLIHLIQQLFQSRNQICLIDSHVMWAKRRKPVRLWRTIDTQKRPLDSAGLVQWLEENSRFEMADH
jgi:hypothetical protein